jgi:flavin-binding protein dodecin
VPDPQLREGSGEKIGMMAFSSLPQVAETNTPRSMDAAGECLSYNHFILTNQFCKLVTTNQKEFFMSVAKVSEIIAASPKSFDDAINAGVARAQKTLKNLKSAWVENQQIKLGENGQITEYRVQLKITFVLDE